MLGAAVLAFTAGCAGESQDSSAPSTGDGTFLVTVQSGPADSTGTVTVGARPTKIVSLSPTATETLWAVGAGDQVVAVDDKSDYPAGVPTTDLSGYAPNVEAIIGKAPDLVIAADDPGGLVSGLKAAGVPTLLLPAAANLDEAYGQIERVGSATGHGSEATTLTASMRTQIAAAVASVPPQPKARTYFHELDDTLYTVTDKTFLGEIYGLFGLRSIAAGGGSGGDYPQLSAEYVVSADPDLIFLADGQCCGVTPDTVAARPGWSGLAAVRDKQIHVLDADLASRWGPRVVDLVRGIAAAAQTVPAAQPTPAG
ncbi:ABC transporter substrate-binding protein [Rhodococcus spelaei]|uniref:ABC transporter substrate-binding protein n=1 Tax=Rhodococcus spelaei TaxID=2546320 RepID=A0A541BAI5_9NOCA|nr:ABC transporter substrate-binding protein [Rhodococcus spelaei]TQF69329.1 ABC transporter substrate-binding protein [Rhodococcus spelaei]